MSKNNAFLIGVVFGVAVLFSTTMAIKFSTNKQIKNKYSDSHLTCTYQKGNINVLICKIIER